MTAFSIQPPRQVLSLLDRLESAGFEAWVVGGCVRAVSYTHLQPPMMVEALRLMPGMMDRHWNRPMVRACLVET